MNLLGKTGHRTIALAAEASRIAAAAVAVIRVGIDPRSWSGPVRQVLANQIFFSGVESVRLVVLLALLSGVAVVTPVQMWLANIGQSGLGGEVLVAVMINSLPALMVTFILIGRSGTAMCAELAGMRNRGEIHVLDAQGLDPFLYLVMPRAAALAISAFALSVCFVAASLSAGWLAAAMSGVTDLSIARYFTDVFRALHPYVILSFLLKALLGGLLVGVIASVEGLTTRGLSTEIPQAVTRGVVVSISAVLVLFVVISWLFYG